VSQTRLSIESPKQRVPPFDGAGLIQSRDLLEIPPPQLTVQLVQFNQELQPPFTKTINEEDIYNMLR
jgi:hypothetical protein